MGGRPAVPGAGGVEEPGREAAGEGAVEPPPPILVGHNLVLDGDRLLLLGRGVLVQLGQGSAIHDGHVLVLLVVLVVRHGAVPAVRPPADVFQELIVCLRLA